MNQADDEFFKRADEHINLSNAQMAKESMGKVSASMMYSVARFNAWISAVGFSTAGEMEAAKEVLTDNFVKEYTSMLSENLDDYINNFDGYMKGG